MAKKEEFRVGELTVDRSAFVDALISSISQQQRLEQEVLQASARAGCVSLSTATETGSRSLGDMSAAARERVEESALSAVEDLQFDFPSPRPEDARALTMLLAESFVRRSAEPSAKRVSSDRFRREFHVAARFVDGLLFCSARHSSTAADNQSGSENGLVGRKRDGKSSGEDSDGEAFVKAPPVMGLALSAECSAELCALVLIVIVRVLVAPSSRDDEGALGLSLAQQLLSDPALEDGARDSGVAGKDDEALIEAEVQRLQGVVANEQSAATLLHDDDEEVWAAEPDDDDFVYEGLDPGSVASAMDSLSSTPVRAPKTEPDRGLSLASAQRRLRYLLRAFSFSAVAALSPIAWARLGLVKDTAEIIKHLRRALRSSVPNDDGARSPLLAIGRGDKDDGNGIFRSEAVAQEACIEEAWVRYAYALRDHLLGLCSGNVGVSTRAAIDDLDCGGDGEPDDEEDQEDDRAHDRKGSNHGTRKHSSGSNKKKKKKKNRKDDKKMSNVATAATSNARSHYVSKDSIEEVLQVFFYLLDDQEEVPSSNGNAGDEVSLSRSVALLIFQSVIRNLVKRSSQGTNSHASSQHVEPNQVAIMSIRHGLKERLPRLTRCLEAVTERLVEIAASDRSGGTHAKAKGQASTANSQQTDRPEGGAMSLTLEQAKVLIVVMAFCCNVTFPGLEDSTSTVCVSGMPPTPLLLSSGMLRGVLKLCAVLTAFEKSPMTSGSEGGEAKPLLVGRDEEEATRKSLPLVRTLALGLLASLVAQGDSIADYSIRAPSTSRLLLFLSSSATQAELLLLGIFLSVGCPASGERNVKHSATETHSIVNSDTIHSKIATAFMDLLSANESACAGDEDGQKHDCLLMVLAWLSCLPSRVLLRIRCWMKRPEGRWFLDWTTSATEIIRQMPSPSITSDGIKNEHAEEGPTTAIDDDLKHARAAVAGQVRPRGEDKRMARYVQDAHRILKQLSEEELGSSKTD